MFNFNANSDEACDIVIARKLQSGELSSDRVLEIAKDLGIKFSHVLARAYEIEAIEGAKNENN